MRAKVVRGQDIKLHILVLMLIISGRSILKVQISNEYVQLRCVGGAISLLITVGSIALFSILQLTRAG